MIERRRASFLPDAIPERKCTEGEKCSPQAQGEYSIFRVPRKGFTLAGRPKHARPDYVARYEDGLHSVSLIKGHWYLYEHVPGGKPHRYIGRITEDGVVPGNERNRTQAQEQSVPAAEPIPLSPLDVTVHEYGFSKAVLDLCPESWKKLVGKRWRNVLIEIIVGQLFFASPFWRKLQNIFGLQLPPLLLCNK